MIVDKEIIDFLKTQKKVTIGFSTGKDSLACAILLKNNNIDFIPFFFYQIPDLEFVEKNIQLYEKELNMEIIRVPHPMLYDWLRHQDFQYPSMIDFLDEKGYIKSSFEDMINLYLYSIGDENEYYDIVGMRANESFNRRMILKDKGAIRHDIKKIYPIHNWSMKDVNEYIIENKYSFTDDYKVWNRSFDGLKYQFLFGVKENYPKDWQTIKEYFPLIELELFRYEKNIEYFKK
jgi:3'-phosphoadenosine 5'-phosphosulfate sulfotransferase (PAPS reductase)/FAD synthetase